MSAPLDLLAGVVAREEAISLVSPISSPPPDANVSNTGRPRVKRIKLDKNQPSDKSCSSSAASHPEVPGLINVLNTGNADTSAAQGDFSPAAAADSKRALRAERNRQSAAASRERKKRHLKELESRVRYLSDVNTALQYRSHVDKQAWNEKEKQLEGEIAKLKRLLASTNSDVRELRNQLEATRKSQS